MYVLSDVILWVIVVLDCFMFLVCDVCIEILIEYVFVICYVDVLFVELMLLFLIMLIELLVVCDDVIDLLFVLVQIVLIFLLFVLFDIVVVFNYIGGMMGLLKGCIYMQGDMVDMVVVFLVVLLCVDVDIVMFSFYLQFWIVGENIGLIFFVFFGVLLVLLVCWDVEVFMVGVQCYCVINGLMLVDSVVEVMVYFCVYVYDLCLLWYMGVLLFVKKFNFEYCCVWCELIGLMMVESVWGMMEMQICNSFMVGMQDDDFDFWL